MGRQREKHPRELLEAFLRDGDFNIADIRSLAAKPAPKEGQWHDFKSAKNFSDRDDTKKDLLQDLTAFANADGGLLIYGVSDDGAVTGGVRPEDEKWLLDVARPLVETGLPRPRSSLQEGILVVGISRGTQLIPLIRGSRSVYFVRIGDGTGEMPDFLLSDLFLGRRAQPKFVLRSATWRWIIDSTTEGRPTIQLQFDLVNDSPVWVDELAVRCIGVLARGEPVPGFLLQQLDIESTDRTHVLGTLFGHWSTKGMKATLPSLASLEITTRAELPGEALECGNCNWWAALCVIPKGGHPYVFQLNISVDLASYGAAKTPGYSPPVAGWPIETHDPWPDRAKVGLRLRGP